LTFTLARTSFLFFTSAASVCSCNHKQVGDMRVHESPLPSTNTRAKEDWLQINGLLNLVNPGNPFHILWKHWIH
jgi:hypothetical protein